jgi:TolB-like protein/DNA-binding winged helix-turn-helix (wHTH) protein/Flp pilus assembly protein TadD
LSSRPQTVRLVLGAVPDSYTLPTMMQQTEISSRNLKFGVFEADLRTGELTRLGKRVRLQEQPFQLLAMLLEKPGMLVTREELHLRLWPQTTVDFDHGLNKAISKIREALGDSAENPRFIETVARRGYRFLADVSVVADEQTEAVTSDPVPQENSEPSRFQDTASPSSGHSARFFASWVFGVVLVVAITLSTMVYPSRLSSPMIHSIVVLPLQNLSSDVSHNFFTEGMTDELITNLAQIRRLGVVDWRTAIASKPNAQPLREIARDLNVDAVVEGSVLFAGDRVRITARLIEMPTERDVWAQSYEGDLHHTLKSQGEIARAVAEQLRNVLDGQEGSTLKKPTENALAYRAYLKGRYFWNERTGDGLKKAIQYFDAAIAFDPKFAEAYSGLADAYALSGDWKYGVLPPEDAFVKAKAAAMKALALNGRLAEAHTSLAYIFDLYGRDWEAADAEYKLAIKLKPAYATLHLWYARHLMMMGKNNESILELRKADSIEPLSPVINANLAEAFCISHIDDKCLEQSRETLELSPNFAIGHYVIGEGFVQRKMYDEAIAEFQKAIELSGYSGAFVSNLAYAYAVSGRKEEAAKIAEDLESQHNPADYANIALIYEGLGDQDQAMTWLDRAYASRFDPSILLRPAFDPLRSDARFSDLLRRLGISQ